MKEVNRNETVDSKQVYIQLHNHVYVLCIYSDKESQELINIVCTNLYK